MSRTLTIKKGLDIKLAGGFPGSGPLDPGRAVEVTPAVTAIVPDDFPGFQPKTEVKEGDIVAAGQPLLHDKRDAEVKLVAPVSGTVKAVVRGERRKIERVEVVPNNMNSSLSFDTNFADTDEIRLFLKNSGIWAMMRQRPYDIVPAGDSIPRDIFVTAIDSAPLAVDPLSFISGPEDLAAMAKAVELLGKLTAGKVYIATRPGSALGEVPGAEMLEVTGPHPSGNVGVHIANVAPVNKGETVWTLDIMTLWRLGKALVSGVVPTVAYVAVVGSEITEPKLVKTAVGADIRSLLAGSVKEDNCHHRIISGNVLVGYKESLDGFLRAPYRQLTVIPEGDDVDEFMGWASIAPSKMSESRTFPGHFLGSLFHKSFTPDARLNGSNRAFIMSGEYDRYMPMDILAEYLLKAIIGRDIDQMEKLGIYEVAPEDFALGEYADTSKMEAQRIVREGLDYLRKELE